MTAVGLVSVPAVVLAKPVAECTEPLYTNDPPVTATVLPAFWMVKVWGPVEPE